MQYGFRKGEKLKKKKLISELFEHGSSLTVYPLRLVYLQADHESPYKLQTGVSVSKRFFKKAVSRNRIKRQMREVFRLNKRLVYDSEHTKKHIFMFVYVGSEEHPTRELDKRMKKLLAKFLERQ